MNRPTLRDQLSEKQRLLAAQREANEQLLLAALRAHEQVDESEATRARAEAARVALEASQERYRTLFDLCPSGVYTCDADGVIVEYNYQAAVLWGRAPAAGDTEERFCGSFKLFRADGSLLSHDQCPMAQVVRGTICGVQEQEVVMERPDGSRLTVVVNIRPLLGERGQVEGAINCFSDITSRRAVEAQLVASLSRERQLAEFREMVLGFLGHDLKNPLVSIIGSASALIRRAYLAEHDGVAVARILRSSQSLSRLVARLLDFTRARLGGGMTIDAKPVDLCNVCRDVLEEFDAPHDLTIEGDVAGCWDEYRLTEALTSLVGHAVRNANPDSPVVLAVQAAGPEVVLELRNQGQSISAEALPFLFEPFRRARDPGDPEDLPGIGLYLAHQVVLAHGGTLVGYSAGGVTTFVMRLPRYPSSSEFAYGDPAEPPTPP
jgi:PAS domain S-box-containing protein